MSVPLPVAIIGGVIVAGGAYFVLSEQGLVPKISDLLAGGKLGPSETGDESALPMITDSQLTTVEFEIVPPNVKPGSPVALRGQFRDLTGNPVRVAKGWYYVFAKRGENDKALLLSGSLGENMSRFNRVISTNGLSTGIHSVRILDRQLSLQESGEASKLPGIISEGIKSRQSLNDSLVLGGGVSMS